MVFCHRHTGLLDRTYVTTHNYGMSSSKHRTSFALDDETIRLLRHLAVQWRVSQAEAVRRAVRQAAEADRSDAVGLKLRLENYRRAGRITAEAAEAYLSALDIDRAAWERSGQS